MSYAMYRYLTKIWSGLVLLLSCFPTIAVAQEISKTYCISGVEYKNIGSLKKELLAGAKREAVNELFGKLIESFTKVEKDILIEDKIRDICAGFIKIKGDPVYHQGKIFGEVCVRITAYAKEMDFEKFKPKKSSCKSCVMEGEARTIKKKAEERAILKALINFDPRLKKYPREQVLPLLHEVKFSEGGFVPGTPTYCVRASGIIYPIEVVAIATVDHTPIPSRSPAISTVSKGKEIARDGHFIAYSNGTVRDTETGLMWAAKDNGKGINWHGAKKYCEDYRGGGYTDWRMPTQDELVSIYDKKRKNRHGYHVTRLIDITNCCPWASETRGPVAALFRFDHGWRFWFRQPGSYCNRALPVRSGN